MQTNAQHFNTAGRILMAIIFVVSGITKIGGYDATQAYMQSMGVPGALLPVVIAFEITAALALIVGFKTRESALALAAFSLLTAALFHNELGNQVQLIMFLKNVAIAGGLLFVAANGPGVFALDNRIYRLTSS